MSFDKLNLKKLGPLKENTPDTLQQNFLDFQDSVQEVVADIKQVNISPINSGVYVDIVALAPASQKTYEHNLNRTPVGWIVVDLTANTTEYPIRISWNKKFITIQNNSPGNNMDVKLLVF